MSCRKGVCFHPVMQHLYAFVMDSLEQILVLFLVSRGPEVLESKCFILLKGILHYLKQDWYKSGILTAMLNEEKEHLFVTGHVCSMSR